MLNANAVPGAQVLGTLPIFPLPNVVLLPGMVLPLNVFEPRYLDLVDFVRANDQHIGVPLLRPQPPLGAGSGPPPFEPIFGVGKLVFHVRLPDGRRIIRLEGVCRVRSEREHPLAHRFREVDATALAEPHPQDLEAVAVLRAQVERVAQHCGDERESLRSLLAISDVRVLLYALTAFLPSLELLATREGATTSATAAAWSICSSRASSLRPATPARTSWASASPACSHASPGAAARAGSTEPPLSSRCAAGSSAWAPWRWPCSPRRPPARRSR
ncbi:LON peptidase substrate-binding domain-containing protein [Nannocystis sp.]|uniref:LON peptidase substrate-binding domain-containing protein n=1 Tax=Nannocystis sp. TaxID=1962667 RepID=UPI0025FCB572|nr:LON peptidase substrate-binding domain-containing protein [Nannocystis sp.]MBK7826846.1 LON peptidase substrate-binding domain-containing protein [Nannocystis sp.]